jgi:hypothetical protein
MAVMRAKMKVLNVVKPTNQAGAPICELVTFTAVCKKEGYDSTGEDENNTFAKWTPTADANFTITNPALFDKFLAGEEYYVDFSKAE